MKKGISLVVLVITIIVMIILAASVVVTLSNTGIINQANKAVDLTNEQQIQDLAALIWSETYMDDKRGVELERIVKEKLKNNGVTEEKWNITVSDVGINITNKSNDVGLGVLITEENYGDTVDYTVAVDGTVYKDWQIFYHNSDYVYIIAANSIKTDTLDDFVPVDTLKNTTIDTLPEGSNTLLDLYNIFRVGNADKFELTGYANCCAVAELVTKYKNFANNVDYGKNVIGAIGGPTIELLATAWETKGYTPTLLPLSYTSYGYTVNGKYNITVTNDGLYVPNGYSYWLASPSAGTLTATMIAGKGSVAFTFFDASSGIRPVVCLKASIPAKIGTGEYDFSLIK